MSVRRPIWAIDRGPFRSVSKVIFGKWISGLGSDGGDSSIGSCTTNTFPAAEPPNCAVNLPAPVVAHFENSMQIT